MFLNFVVSRRWWTYGRKIDLADVLEPDAFVTGHVSFKAGDEDDEAEEESDLVRMRAGKRWQYVRKMPSMKENAA